MTKSNLFYGDRVIKEFVFMVITWRTWLFYGNRIVKRFCFHGYYRAKAGASMMKLIVISVSWSLRDKSFVFMAIGL